MQFLDWRFGSGLASATHIETGEHIRFTRAECALLKVLVRHPERVHGREHLLDAVAGLDSVASDRSIDFLINHLRRKLGDSARQPRYIRTHYGQGYAWIAQQTVIESLASGAFIVVGPLRGLEFVKDHADEAGIFAEHLTAELNRRTGASRPVCLDPHCPAPEHFQGAPPEFAAPLYFLETSAGALDCVLAFGDYASIRPMRSVSRVTVCDPSAGAAAPEVLAAQMARALMDSIWTSYTNYALVSVAPETEPLPVRLHTTSELLSSGAQTWQDAQRRLRAVLRDNPRDHEAQMKLATVLHTQYVLAGSELLLGPDAGARRRADEAEIERLVMAALPHVHSNDIFLLCAAKLLHSIDAAHEDFALDLAESVLQTTTALVSAFATVGQLRAFAGRIEDGVALVDQGLALAKRHSYLEFFLLNIKCQVLSAAGAGEAAAEATREWFNAKPRSRRTLELCVLFDAMGALDMSAEVDAVLDGLDEPRAHALVLSLYHPFIRPFRSRAHRANLLRRPVTLVTERLGWDGIPDEVLPDLPNELRAAAHNKPRQALPGR